MILYAYRYNMYIYIYICVYKVNVWATQKNDLWTGRTFFDPKSGRVGDAFFTNDPKVFQVQYRYRYVGCARFDAVRRQSSSRNIPQALVEHMLICFGVMHEQRTYFKSRISSDVCDLNRLHAEHHCGV